MKNALFIGRFQPFHKAHLSDVKLAIQEHDSVIIAIGSSHQSRTNENPFTYKERKEMIQTTLKANDLSNYNIVPVPDVNDDERWVSHVKKLVPNFDVVYTGNDFTEKLFKERNIEVRKISLIKGISSTEVRKRILHNKDWQDLVPKEVRAYIEDNGGQHIIKEIHN